MRGGREGCSRINWKGVDIYCVLIDKGISGVAPCKCVIVRWMKDIVVMDLMACGICDMWTNFS